MFPTAALAIVLFGNIYLGHCFLTSPFIKYTMEDPHSGTLRDITSPKYDVTPRRKSNRRPENFLFESPNEDGSTADTMFQDFDYNDYDIDNDTDVDSKLTDLESRVAQLNRMVQENSQKVTRGRDGAFRDEFVRQSTRTINDVGNTIRHLEGVVSDQTYPNPSGFERLKEQARILEHLAQTLKQAVLHSENNREDIEDIKRNNRQRFSATVRRLNEQAILMKSIQDEVANAEIEKLKRVKEEFDEVKSGVSHSMSSIHERMNLMERLVSEVKTDITGLEDDLGEEIKENKDKIHDQNVDLIHMTYGVNQVEGDLQDFLDDHDGDVEDIRKDLAELNKETEGQKSQLDMIDDVLDDLRSSCCGDNMNNIRNEITSLWSDVARLRVYTDECIIDVNTHLSEMNGSYKKLKDNQDTLQTKLVELEDLVKLERFKREQDSIMFRAHITKSDLERGTMREKQSFDLAGVKAAINVLTERNNQNSVEYSELRTRSDYLEHEDRSLQEQIEGIQDSVLKLTETIHVNTEANRHFLQQLIQDLIQPSDI